MGYRYNYVEKILGFSISGLIVLTPLLSSWNVSAVGDTKLPEWRNQGQSANIILQGSSIVLSAQGRDNISLKNAYLSTNETGTWENISGQYGSPITLNSDPDQWIWTNFTWQNPDISEDTRVGWKICYIDVDGNINCTDIMSFTITSNNPPNTPDQPSGPNTGYIGIQYNYISSEIVDPMGHDVACLFDWGDETKTNWTDFKPSGRTFSLNHTWDSEGVYHVKVQAKDNYDALSEWSPSKIVEIRAIDLPKLDISSPYSVVEGEIFQVTITSDGEPIKGASVEFRRDTELTDADGRVNFKAPPIVENKVSYIIARLSGYTTSVATITILNKAEEPLKVAWIYGQISDEYGSPIEEASICVQSSEGTTISKCVFTDADGQYNIRLPPETYDIKATKPGYQTSTTQDITIYNGEALEHNIILKKNISYPIPSTLDHDIEIIDAAIQFGISGGIVGGEMDVKQQKKSYNIIVYKDITVENVTIEENEVSFTIGAENETKTILVLRIYSDDEVSNIQITYDNETIEQVGFGEIFNALSKTPKYNITILNTGNGSIAYCFVYIGNFSTHQITVFLEELLKGIGGTTAFLIYIATGLGVIILMMLPILIFIIRYQSSWKK